MNDARGPAECRADARPEGRTGGWAAEPPVGALAAGPPFPCEDLVAGLTFPFEDVFAEPPCAGAALDPVVASGVPS